MCLIAYTLLIIYARVNLTPYYIALYSMLVLFAVVESILLTQAGLEKAQRGSTSTVQSKVSFEII